MTGDAVPVVENVDYMGAGTAQGQFSASANGTLVNGAEVPTGVQVPLRDGDRINLGAWTAIAVHRG